MSKRRLENEINELSEEILSALPPDERARLLLTASGEGKDEWIDLLFETCSQHTYVGVDYRVIVRLQINSWLAVQAVYELHTMYLAHHLCWQQQISSWRERGLSKDELERIQARAEIDRELVARLYVLYHSYRRFATETVGVEIDTWLRLHPNGPAVFAAVGDLLDDPWQMRLAEAHVIELFQEMVRTGEIEDVDPAEALEWLVEQRYAGLVESWESTIAQVS